ncbi:rhomboid family intramembrane serine protease [[Limnothrix rosea] IAM M-220]|uniref:rhomboid family intramembrane serine protease n=1 Tax=[Limnothrix rosea] IAM M-220 TaxID=454133 RepID=UPI000964E544|nr:rhomboid family intramembrane serine protease [[Limnothrix rosea] IAM M-220]OKH18239.1 rhomboid family intramembrane serine protease [[Limnothrix rosea] IAM M-220]
MSRQNSQSSEAIAKEVRQQVMILGSFLLTFWLLEISDQFVFQKLWRGGLDVFGIIPRNMTGLRGVIFAPFLHGDFQHLMANTLPFGILGWLVMFNRIRDFWTVTAIATVIGGLGVWLVGAANSVHLGASILIFGYLGFLLFRGYFQRDIPSLALAGIVFFFYGGVLWGVLPVTPGVSWEGHLFGFIGGGVAAKLLSNKP